MSQSISPLFNYMDKIQMASLNHRLKRNQVQHANLANSETPGFRAIGYDFEEQLQTLSGVLEPLSMKVTSDRHKQNAFTQADGSVSPDVFVKPTESVSHDGNTVDVDQELTELSHNQILYRTAVESINRKIGLLKYAIHGGRG